MFLCFLIVYMQRKFVVNLLFLFAINLIVKPFWIFGIDRTVQNTLNSEVYGEYFVLFNVSLLFNILLDLGLTGYNTRSIAQNAAYRLVGMRTFRWLVSFYNAGVAGIAVYAFHGAIQSSSRSPHWSPF